MLCRVLCVLFFIGWTGERAADEMYYGGWRSVFGLLDPVFLSLPGLHLSIWQVLLILLGPLCMLQPGAFRRRAWPMDAAILAGLATIAVTFAAGVARGGSAYQAYYQLRAPVTTLYLALLLIAVVRTPADLRAFARTLVAAALVRATLSTYFYVMYVRGRQLDPWPQYMTAHDDSLLFTAAIMILLAWAAERHRWTTWAWFLFVFVWIAAGIKTNNRRLAWLELAAMLVFAYLLLRRGRLRRRINRFALVAAPVLLVYVAVGWGRGGGLFAPVRAISSTVGSGERKDLSSIARNEENLNLVWTYQKSPLLGVGWGKGYQEASSAFTQGFGKSFWQYSFLPHNSLVAIATFGGAVGLAGMLLVLPIAAFLATRGYGFSNRPLERAAAMAALCYLPAWAEQAFGDIGLQSHTGGMILAMAFATASKVAAWSGAWPTRVPLRLVRPAQAVAADDGRAA